MLPGGPRAAAAAAAEQDGGASSAAPAGADNVELGRHGGSSGELLTAYQGNLPRKMMALGLKLMSFILKMSVFMGDIKPSFASRSTSFVPLP